MRRSISAVILIGLVLGATGAPVTHAGPSTVVPLARAHAHNDYLHQRPLLDALDHGFTSIEADVWLVAGDLLVAHELRETRAGRTLRTLYLEPLQRLIRERGGRVYQNYTYPLTLLVDVKSDAEATYRILHEQLRPYEAMLTVVTASGVRTGGVFVIISGNRPKDLMLRQSTRYAGYDGRMPDLGGPLPATFMPLVSDHWMRHFAWRGIGPMPDDERAKLREIVDRAHAGRQRVRFWATPDSGPAAEAVWLELLRAGVDYINTDRLDALRQFLLRADPTPSTPPLP